MKKLMMVGDYISTAEEFVAGEGTYEDDGKIYASNIGELVLDERSHVARIEAKYPIELKLGQVVFGYVLVVRPAIVSVIVTRIKGFKGEVDIRTGIHVSQISNGYIKAPQDAFGMGDIVKGKVIKIEPDLVDLTTKGKDLGIVKAFCKHCRNPLKKIDQTDRKQNLKCKVCGNKEYRKISSDYGFIGEI